MTDLFSDKIALGWVVEHDQFNSADAMIYAPRELRAGMLNCECNDRPPALMIHRYCIRDKESYLVEIVGEQDSIWLKLQVYSLEDKDVDKAITRLRKAWGEA